MQKYGAKEMKHGAIVERFLATLDDLCSRPGLYVGTPSIRAASHFLNGYIQALEDAGEPYEFILGWQRWVELKFLIFSPDWHWSRILAHEHGNEAAALGVLPQYFREFLADRQTMTVDDIETTLRARMRSTYGKDWHRPRRTHTQEPWFGEV